MITIQLEMNLNSKLQLQVKSSVQSKLLGLQWFLHRENERQLRDTEHFKALTTNCHESAIADHVFLTNHKIKWDHLEILATGRSDIHCKIKESMLIHDLKPVLNENVGSKKLHLYH